MSYTKTDIDKVWNAVYDQEVLNSDPDVARNLADKIKKTLAERNTYELQVQRNQMVNNIKTFGKWLMWIALGLVVATLIGWGIRGAFRSNDNDYAGFGPNKVSQHDVNALNKYFSAKNVVLMYRKRGHAPTGEKAWVSKYRVDKQVLCVYVWSDGTFPENSKVTQGGC